MQTAAQVIADSISPNGDRLTTMVVTMHRFVLAEFNTHRVFSRNSASSRAIPVGAQLQRVIEYPAYPLEWRSEQPGMQGGTELEGQDLQDARLLFSRVKQLVTREVEDYLEPRKTDASRRLHKSLINRLLEPFMWHTVIVSSTEWENFFALRCHEAAQPEIRIAAMLMEDAYRESNPVELDYDMWHTPFIDKKTIKDWGVYSLEAALKTSAARCAWVSYLKHGQEATYEDVERIYDILTNGMQTGEQIHASPFEHQATPVDHDNCPGNFRGWFQLRHHIEMGELPWN